MLSFSPSSLHPKEVLLFKQEQQEALPLVEKLRAADGWMAGSITLICPPPSPTRPSALESGLLELECATCALHTRL